VASVARRLSPKTSSVPLPRQAGDGAGKLALYCPFYAMPASVPSHPMLRFLPEEAVLPIFWTLRIARPMSDEGGGGRSRISILSFPPNLTRANKESPDMKRAMFSVATLVVLAGLAGCATQHGLHPLIPSCGSCAAPAAEGCQSCDASCNNGSTEDPEQCVSDPGRGCRLCKGRRVRSEEPMVDPGPPTGAVTYPYYTTRGPRDFLARNPQSIGP
jgi:hypothetical protein